MVAMDAGPMADMVEEEVTVEGTVEGDTDGLLLVVVSGTSDWHCLAC